MPRDGNERLVAATTLYYPPSLIVSTVTAEREDIFYSDRLFNRIKKKPIDGQLAGLFNHCVISTFLTRYRHVYRHDEKMCSLRFSFTKKISFCFFNITIVDVCQISEINQTRR